MGLSRFRGAVAIAAIGGLVLAACAKSANPSVGGSTPTAGATGISETKDSAIAAEVPANIASKGTLTIASDASYPPMEYFAADNKTVIGADVDIIHAVGQVLGLTANVQNATFATIIPGLQSGKFDVGVSSFFDTLEREKVVDMVGYFHAGSAIAVKASSSASYTSLSQLCGMTVAAEAGTTELDDANAASKKCPAGQSIKVLSFQDQNGANLAVVSGRADAVLADSEVCDYAVKYTNGQLKVAGQYLAPIQYAMAVPRPKDSAKGSGPLTKAIFDALKKIMSDGTYLRILQKWGIAKWGITMPGINQATS